MINAKHLIGIVNPLGEIPCFATPIFESDSERYVQIIDVKGTILEFANILVPDEFITRIYQHFTLNEGEMGIFAFYFSKDNIVLQAKEALKSTLRSSYDKFIGHPFLQVEISDFICDENSKAKAISEAYASIIKENNNINIQWIDFNGRITIDTQKRVNANIYRAMIDVGNIQMEVAKFLFNKQDYYKAKTNYQKALELLNKALAFTVTHRLEKENININILMEDCITHIKACTNNLCSTLIENVSAKLSQIDGYELAQLENELKDEYKEIKWLKKAGVNYLGLAHNNEGKTVVLKLPKYMDTSTIKSFLHQRLVWQNLQHRNIVKLIDTNISPPMLVFEYVDGRRLDDVLKHSRVIGIKNACQIINDVARGLEYAHSQNIIHGDLKPSNILITKTGEAKITDWGLSKVFTNYYAAPEQIEGHEPNEKTDIYQLGLIFYEILHGENPFTHASILETETKTETRNRSRTLHSETLNYIDIICVRCLSTEPENRPKIAEFRKNIYSFLKEQYYHAPMMSIDIKTQINELSDLAMLASKQNEQKDLQDTLKSLLLKLSEEERRKLIQDFKPKMSYINIIYETKPGDSIIQVRTNSSVIYQDEIVNETENLVKEVIAISIKNK